MQTLTVDTELEKHLCPHWGLVGTAVWGIIIFVAFVFLQTVTFGAIIGFSHGIVSPTETKTLISDLQYDGFVLAACTIATTFGCGLLLFGVIKLKRGATINEYLGIQPISSGEIRTWVAVAVVVVGIFDGLNILLGRDIVPEFMSIAYSSADPVWLLWIALVLAAPPI